MKIAISGTYSSGKTITVMALSHFTNYPRTLAKAIREIIVDAMPGKNLADVTPAEFLNLMMLRHTGRVAQEVLLPNGFISDGSSLNEWLYGAARIMYGMNPNATFADDTIQYRDISEEMQFFEKVVEQYGISFKRHVKNTFDFFIHLRHELPIKNDGHRPMNTRFRDTINKMMLSALDELKIPYYEVSGTIAERLSQITDLLEITTVINVEEAISRAQEEYSKLDKRLEAERYRALSTQQ